DAAEFHFSPRPNRADEIKWRPWSQASFDEAKALDRPILLSISAVWCHWCHVMDETTYSNQGVIDMVNSEYLPIRVDNDVRPDINQRYNMGGWPTTAFLTPTGDILTGATYLPPEQMAGALGRVASYHSTHGPGRLLRHSAAQDWSVPHCEKMLEDHAGLLAGPAPVGMTKAADTATPYLGATLRDPATGLLAGRQDADEHYYGLDAAGRAKL